MSSSGTVLVYCAAGAQGAAIVRASLAGGAKVRILLRDGAANPFGDQVEVVRGDLADPARLRLASLGVDKVVLTLPQIADRAMAARLGRNAIDAARAAGVKLLVWNASGPVPPAHTGVAVIDAVVSTERFLRASGFPAIIVRPTLYMENLTASWSAPAIVHNGVFAHPLPADFRVSWISLKDLAAFVAAALERADLAGRTFDIGGPDGLTGPEVAEILSTAVGRRVAYVPVPLSYFAAGLNAALGGKTGDEIAAFYGWVQRQPASPLAVDLEPVLAELPVRPTALSDWATAGLDRARVERKGSLTMAASETLALCLAPLPPEAVAVVDFWRDAGPGRWFAKDADFDKRFRERFLSWHDAAAQGELAPWRTSATGALASVLLLDQFPRNAFRGTPRMYATDAMVRALAASAIAAGYDRAVETALQLFFYLPFAHSEDLADQERSVALARRLGQPHLSHAEGHHDIVRRFGRFPHRNPIFGRQTTPAEKRFLDDGGFAG